MQEGYILVYRQLLNNSLLTEKPYCKGFAWLTLLLLTNHKRGFIKTKNGKLIEIQRGECGYSEKALSEIFGWSRSKIRTYFKHLKDERMIQQKIIENHSIIKVLNYENFQMRQQKNENLNNKQDNKTYNKTYNKKTQTKNEKEEREYKYSLSTRAREVLKKYLLSKPRKEPIYDIEAYIAYLEKNGNLAYKVEKAEKWQKRQEKKQEELIPAEEPELSKEEQDQNFEQFRRRVQKMRSKNSVRAL